MRPAQVGSRAIPVAGHGAATREVRVAQGTGPPSGTDVFPSDCLLARTRESLSFWPRTYIALNNKRQMAHPTRFERVTVAFGGQTSPLPIAGQRFPPIARIGCCEPPIQHSIKNPAISIDCW